MGRRKRGSEVKVIEKTGRLEKHPEVNKKY